MISAVLQSLTRPSELQALLKYKFGSSSANKRHFHAVLARDEMKRRCYYYLNQTSRSFVTVIQELDDELRDAVCIFYLVLRGLDTIEDDMTLDLERKDKLLRSFHEVIYQPGWTFTENGPNEKDRELLCHFDVVIAEFFRLKPAVQKVIQSVTLEMGKGMADYASGEHRVNTAVNSIKDFDLYCHYVAGLVGYGLSDLFVVSNLEEPSVATDKALSNDMGLFLQKTNIIRDYREDLDDGRQFWPREIWENYVTEFSDLIKPENKDKARACLSAMVLNVLHHVPQVLTYLNKLQHQSVFNFCAIPQVMAIATLALVFNNLDVYQRNVKIRKGEAVKMILASTNMNNVVSIFRHYTHIISQKNDATDPNFVDISIAVGKIEQWIAANIPPTKTASVSTFQGSWVWPLVIGLLGILVYQAYSKTTV